MRENQRIHLTEIPIGGKGGFVWNRLHGEREDICEALVKDPEPESQADQRRELLHSRLRKLDDALDRLMSGSYGICSKCGGSIEDASLDVDPAWALCLDCSNDEPRGAWSRAEMDSASEVLVECLNQFDTVLLRTQNSEYRILLLDPKTGRALVEGGAHFVEPSEALLMGSALSASDFKSGVICAGHRLEIWCNDKVFLTSPIKSVGVKHNPCAESVQSISAALH
ncbi:MAG TPA: TraR/DksA C4-type zinc finger protein [Pyrinomonadaceae bacterium]|nr:TraR/DksA C4-type zinc finger protein [Pyrinomonadaceae bacterium]